jgi:hypothetical protein
LIDVFFGECLVDVFFGGGLVVVLFGGGLVVIFFGTTGGAPLDFMHNPLKLN